jgi:hypothetical protein
VLLGERNLGQQVLEIVVLGYNTLEEAEAALRRDAGAMIQIQLENLTSQSARKISALRKSAVE